ncbi:hypothetical protein HY629_00770 [Candidatus Uhrbacteria bacterium]|nr:hypothetical protein [Candidatus Uhrbacteria bacterium]
MRRSITLLSIAALALVVGGSAHATDVTLGASFDTAPLLGAGSYSASVTLTNSDKSRYFKIEIPMGKMATVKAKYAKGGSGSSLALSIHDDERASLQSETASDPEEWVTVRRAPGKSKEAPASYTYYIQLRHNFVDTVIDPSFTIAFENVGDLGTEQDAGGDFETAMSLPSTSGSYTGFLASTREGGDLGDYYALSLEKGQQFAFKLTPDSNSRYEIKTYKEDRSEVESARSSNPGQILKLAGNIVDTQKVYVAVLQNDSPSAHYAFDVTLTGGTKKQLGTDDTAGPGGSLVKAGVYHGIGIEFVPPKKWTEIPIGDAQVLFQAPGAAGVLGKNINVNIETLEDSRMTLKKYTNAAKKLLKLAIGKFKISPKESATTTLGGYKASRVVYTGQLMTKRGPITAKWMQYYIIKDGKAYIITFTAAPSEYKKDLKKITASLKTFKITE